MYKTASFPDLVESFPERTPLSIRKKANKMGLEANRSARFQHLSPWDDESLRVLMNEYPSGVPVDEIAAKVGVSTHAIYRKARELSLERDSRKFRVNDDIFDEWSEETAYWVGFIAADGYLREDRKEIVVCLSIKDRDYLLQLNNIVQPERPLIVDEARGRVTCTINSDAIYDRLVSIGLTPRKTHTLEFPTVPSNYERAFIRGYFDGDGSVYMRGDGLRGVNILGTRPFLLELQPKVPAPLRGPRRRSQCNIFIVSAVGKKANQFHSWLYENAAVFIRRKRFV